MAEKDGSKPPPGLDNFDQLMKKLAKVPKAEVDAEAKKHAKRKARKAAKRQK